LSLVLADAEGAVQELRAGILGVVGDPVDFQDQLISFRVDLVQVATRVGRGGLGGQFLETGQHVAHLIHGPFRDLEQGVALRDVPARHVVAGDGSPESLRNGQPRRIILGGVDPVTR